MLVNDFIERLPLDFPLVALQRGTDPGRPIKAINALARSKNVTEARQALLGFTAMIGHWSLADADGNVAYVGTVRLPKRTAHLGTVPVPGWTGTYEWNEFVPVEDLPWTMNPAGGFVGTANNQVIQPESFGVPINFEGDVPFRYSRIEATLAKGSNGKPVARQMMDLEMDSIDAGIDKVRPLYTRALEPLTRDADPVVAKATTALLAWDGRTGPKTFEPTIFHSLNAWLVRRTMEDEESAKGLDFILSYFNAEPLVYGILSDPDNPAWDDRRTPQTERAEDVIVQGMRETAKALSAKYGPKPEEWTWSKCAPFVLHHPFGGKKALAKYLNRGPLPTQGAGNTVFKHQFSRKDPTRFAIEDGPSLRVAVDLSDLAQSFMSLPGGESGRPGSEHYDDLLPLYLTGQGVSMDMDFGKIEKQAKGRILLTPEGANGK